MINEGPFWGKRRNPFYRACTCCTLQLDLPTVGFLDRGSISHCDKPCNFILVSVNGRPEICFGLGQLAVKWVKCSVIFHHSLSWKCASTNRTSCNPCDCTRKTSRSKAHNLDWHQIQRNLKGNYSTWLTQLLSRDLRGLVCLSWSDSQMSSKWWWRESCAGLLSLDATYLKSASGDPCAGDQESFQQKRWMFTWRILPSSRKTPIESSKLSWMRPDVASRRSSPPC